jgi:hypothetical protein
MNSLGNPSPDAFDALLRRADSLRQCPGLEASTRGFWAGYAKALRDLQSGVGDKLAAKDFALQHGTGRHPRAAAAAVLQDRGGNAV